MKSEVEVNQRLVLVGDVLFYTDSSNAQRWVVTELFQGGFVAKDDYEEKDFIFTELQLGWEISQKSKQLNTSERHFRYV